MSRLRTKIPLRYPGGKQRFLNELAALLPEPDEIAGQFVEPFVGGGAVFFSFGFKDALLSDVNEWVTHRSASHGSNSSMFSL